MPAYADLRALYVNTSLKKNPDDSHTRRLLDASAAIMEKNGVAVEHLHLAAHEVAPGRPRPGHNKWGPDPLLAEHDPDFVFHCYAIHSKPTIAPLGCGAFWRAPARGFEQRTIEVPGLVGEREGRDDDGGPGPAKYYTFLVKRDRAFACPGLVP